MWTFGSRKGRADRDRLAELGSKFEAIDRSQAVIEFNLDGTIITANQNFLTTLGYSLEEIVGRHHSMFVEPSYGKSPDYRHFWERLNRAEHIADKFKRIGKNGKECWIQASYSPVLDKDSKPIKVLKLATDITASELEHLRIEQERASQEDGQKRTVKLIAASLRQLAEGDLGNRLTESLPAEYESLRVDFNKTVEQLQEVLASVGRSAETMRSGTDEMSAAVDNLSRRTEQQAASLEQTAAALDEITATVRKTATGAAHARQAVGTAKKDAEQSGVVVRQAVEAMSGIEKSSQQIGQIIGVIDEIAFQTNLLALNAGVEAARAGDAGRGFAVVASEVRALAQRSAEAAKEIKALVSASTHQVDKGVELVGQTGVALERIVTQVTEINGIVAEIANSAQEQATGLDQVNTAVNQMDQMTQQNAAMVEQTTAASHALSEEANELNQLIGRFRLDEGEGGRAGVPALRHRGSAPAARPGNPLPSGGGKATPVRTAAPKSSLISRLAAAPRSVPAMKRVGRGGALPKAEPAASEVGWEEF
ncbi:MAG TPA: PAS domain-containing methyl-accepting chemotaxis protein [Lichenihabitans sp.]|jgi:methyl-accepting chemotaxis protein|nr:PAS domain-containing methyl-accepting chemotaxis protein [Lichenihabitans sp.]